ncbi:MAG: class I SAM-dependent methyltransferase [Nocardioides sp.]
MSHEHEITPEMFEQPSWDERYGGADRVWSGRPNAVLAADAADLPPGRALDLGCGEGGDAIWLAERGWQVTAVDFSETGLARAAAHAAERGVADRVEWRQADLRHWTPDGEQWDLVTSHFLHLLGDAMVSATRQMAAAVAPGGTLLVVGHHVDDEHTGLRWSMPGVLLTAEQLAVALDPAVFEIHVEARKRQETRHEGAPMTVTDAVLAARRRM